MGCLARAYEIYESFKELKIPNVYNNRSEEPKDRDFKCYY